MSFACFLSVNQTENVQRGVQKAHFGDPPVLKKKESPYLQESPDASTWSHVMLKIVELRTLLGKVGRDCCRVKHIYPVCIPAPIAYIQLSETCQLDVQHAHVNHCYVEALLTQGKVSW